MNEAKENNSADMFWSSKIIGGGRIRYCRLVRREPVRLYQRCDESNETTGKEKGENYVPTLWS